MSFHHPPWRQHLSTDHAIPYAMFLAPWSRQDFYYWHAARFGSLYVVLWKAVFGALLGRQAWLFYFGHCCLYFVGFIPWLLLLKRWWSRVAFLWVMLPTSALFVQMFVLPGQLHGMSFVLVGWMLLGLFHWLQSAAPQQANGITVLMGLLCGLAYWQHEPTSLLCLLLFLGGMSCLAASPAGWQWCICWRALGWFSLGFLPVLAFAEVARQWSFASGALSHYGLVDWRTYGTNLAQMLSRGLAAYQSPWFGRLMLGLILWSAGSRSMRRDVDKHVGEAAAWEGVVKLKWLHRAFFCSAMLTVLGIAASRWYAINHYDDRYLLFLLAPGLFFLLKDLESKQGGPRQRACKAVGLAVALVLVHSTDVFGFVFTKSGQAYLRAFAAERQEWLDAVQAAGCRGFVGTEKIAAVLVVLTDGAVAAQGQQMLPYDEEHARAVAGLSPLCLDRRLPREDLLRFTQGRHCQLDDKLWRCE